MSRTPLQAFARLDTDTPDAALLERSGRGDPEAFARLVARHGPMVFAVARRILGSGPDAEDAFQATFLVLFRRLHDVRQPENLAGWLYGVAQRTASEARRGRLRRENRLKKLAPPVADRNLAEPELHELVHREVAALPEHYRLPIALCDLDGRSRSEVAALLRIPEGTLSSRLNAGRKRLASRFAKLGYASANVGILAEVAAAHPSAMPPNFDPTGPISPSVQTLVDGVTRMLNAKTLLTWCLVACGAFALAGGTALVAFAQAPPPVATPRPGATPKPVAEAEKPVDFKVSDAPPVVVKTVPEAGAEGVDPELKEVRVTFSKKMLDMSWSWASDEGYGHVIEGEKPAFDKDGKTNVRPVKLKPNTTYAVWFNTPKFDNFKDTDERPLVPYLLVFRTGPGKGK